MKLATKTFQILPFIFALICVKSIAQSSQTSIQGKIYSDYDIVSNVHIVNLNTKIGTISNKNGEFQINVSLNDSILISSIQYKSLIIGINKTQLTTKILNVKLAPLVNKLDEVFLHGLTGSLSVDLNSVPSDTLPKHSFKYKLSDLDKKLPNDTHGFLSAPNSLRMTDPTYMEGTGASAAIPDYYMIALRKLKKELKNKKAFPIKIRKELGIEYFTRILNIQEDKIDHFLTFCEGRNIIEYYNNNNLLEIIKILREESKIYHEIKP